MNDPQTIVFQMTTRTLPSNVIGCPRCGGMGSLCDGSAVISPTEIRFTPASKCPTCDGTRLLSVQPYRE